MGRILAMDGTELCKMLACERSGDAMTVQVSVEDEVTLGAINRDLLFEDGSGQRRRGRVQATKVYGAGGSASAVVHAVLYDD